MPLGIAVIGLGPGRIVLDGDSSSPRKGAQQHPTFAVYGGRQYKPQLMSIVAKRLAGSGCHLIRS